MKQRDQTKMELFSDKLLEVEPWEKLMYQFQLISIRQQCKKFSDWEEKDFTALTQLYGNLNRP